VSRIRYDRVSVLAFRLENDRNEYILLRAATPHFEQYQQLLRLMPCGLVRLTVWAGVLNERFAFVRDVKRVWPQPTGVRLILYFNDGTFYAASAKNSNRLALLAAKTFHDHAREGEVTQDLAEMLAGVPVPQDLPASFTTI
jgi:hypothetical protein